MESVGTVEINHYAPIPRGHRVAIHTFDVKLLFMTGTAMVVQDLTTGVWYGGDLDLINWVRGRAAPPGNTPLRRETLVGRVRQTACVASYGEHGRSSTELDVVVEEIVTGDAEPRSLRSQNLGAAGAELYGSDTALEQRWPHGVTHAIRWDQPFTIAIHRDPGADASMATMDLHLRLTQRRDARAESIAITLVVPTEPELMTLPPIAELHPRVQGPEAAWLLATVRYYARVHGVQLPA